MQGYTAETVIVGRALQKDFEQRGVHLDVNGQGKALQMSQQIAVMGMHIGQSYLSTVCWRVQTYLFYEEASQSDRHVCLF